MESINQFVLYTGENGDVKLKLYLEDRDIIAFSEIDSRAFPG